MSDTNDKSTLVQSPPSEPQSDPVLRAEDKRAISMSVLSTKTDVMDPVAYKQMQTMAADMMKSGAIAKKFENADQVMMALLAGREMGLGFQESLNDLYFVGGSLQIYGKGTPGALRRNGWRIQYSDEDQGKCTATIKNTQTGEEITDTFTFAEAELSGFVKDNSGKFKPGWMPGANRRRKLRYGVLSLIIHTYVPEVLGPVAGIGEYTEDYIEGSATVTHDPQDSGPSTRQNDMAAAEQRRKSNKASAFTPRAVNQGGPQEAEGDKPTT